MGVIEIMRVIKIFVQIAAFVGLINPLYAAIPPYPFQVLQTCINNKPYDDNVTMLELGGGGAAINPLDGCEDQYDFMFNEHAYGTASCSDKFYLVIRDLKIDPAIAENLSINPEIKPGFIFSNRASWSKIDQDNKSYLCIRAALTDSGVGSACNQYYIVENAFTDNKKPILYYHFYEKDIMPITSPHL